MRAAEDPARWARWAATSPVRREDISAASKTVSRRTLRRTALTSTAGQAIGRTWAEDPVTGTRRDFAREESRAFLTWAAVEVLRAAGIRAEELTELSHHSPVQYRLPSTGELISLLHIAPSKTGVERLLVISPELAEVLAAVIARVRDSSGTVPLVIAYDAHECEFTPPMPVLFQHRAGAGSRPISAAAIRRWITAALEGTGITDASGQLLAFQPHDFRRIFATDAIMNGMPIPKKRSAGTGRSPPAAANCGPAKNTVPRPTPSGKSSSAISNAAVLPSATADGPGDPAASMSTHA